MQITREMFNKLTVLPIILALISFAILINAYLSTGEFLERDIDLKGGMQLSVQYQKAVDIDAFESYLRSELSTKDIRVRSTTNPTTGKQTGLVIEAGITDEKKLESAASSFLKMELTDANRSITNFGSALAATFWRQAKKALLVAGLLMGLIVVYTFRKPILFTTILANVVLDVITAVAAMSFFGIKLSLASIAALLMVMDFGVDSTILLCTRALKERGGTTVERVNEALKTGLTMSAAVIASLIAILWFAQAPELRMIAEVLLFGLIADTIYTWTMNVFFVLRVSKE